jgi:hypothetical protein
METSGTVVMKKAYFGCCVISVVDGNFVVPGTCGRFLFAGTRDKVLGGP